MLIKGLEKNNVSNYQFFFPIFPKVVLLIDIIFLCLKHFITLVKRFFLKFFSASFWVNKLQSSENKLQCGEEEKTPWLSWTFATCFCCFTWLILSTPGKNSRRTCGARVWFYYCCLLKLLPVQLGKHTCPWMLSFWNTMLELFQMVERLRYCYIGVEQCCD